MTVYDFQVNKTDGSELALSTFENDVLLIVNTASKCGFAPQLGELQELYDDYHAQGFTVLGFPCNQFLGQEPKSNEEIIEFCQLNYGVTFPVFAKLDVRGKNQAPLYNYLINTTDGKKISWNFTKFLIDRQGNVVKRYAPATKPQEIVTDLELLLK